MFCGGFSNKFIIFGNYFELPKTTNYKFMKRIICLTIVLASAVAFLSGCGCYKKMVKKSAAIEASCVPQVLSLRGSSVDATITVNFPAKFFDKEAVIKVTPVLVFQGGEIQGTSKYLQGEKVHDNYTVIPWKTGGSYTQAVSFPYDPRANISTLVLNVEVKCPEGCKKVREYTDMGIAPVIARGISTLQANGSDADYLSIMPDNFKRVTTNTQEAQIMFEIQRSNVRSGQLTTDQIKMFEEFVKANSNAKDVTLGNVYSKGYASPDGPVNLNDKLAKERSESAKKAVSKQLKGVDVKYDVAAYGEDWDGFKALVEQSDIADKGLILQVLQMYDNPVKRDQEIKNMSAVFDVLAKEILPQLRRTKLVASADVKGLTDAQIADAAKNNVSSLNLEQLLYAATLTQDNNQKASLYSYAADKYNDARAYNNLGVVLLQQQKTAEAQKALSKAASLSSAPEISNNLGALAIAQGDVAAAKRYLSSLNTPQAQANKGLIALSEGNYGAATQSLKGYDLALAQVLNGNLPAAKTALTGQTSADADYLRAVIAMREGDSKNAIANLKSSIAKDPAMKAKAAADIEFAKLFGAPEFKAL